MKAAVLFVLALGLLVLVVLLIRQHSRQTGPSEQPELNAGPPAPDWINVRVGSPGQVLKAVESYSQLYADQESLEVTAVIATIQDGTVGVTFSDKIPPYTFLNLLGWLHAPPGVEGVTSASGWYSSPSSGVRFTFWPDESNPRGDTLIGVSSSGEFVGVFHPDISFWRITRPVEKRLEPASEPSARFGQLRLQVPVEVMGDFGNPTLEFTHPPDTAWY